MLGKAFSHPNVYCYVKGNLLQIVKNNTCQTLNLGGPMQNSSAPKFLIVGNAIDLNLNCHNKLNLLIINFLYLLCLTNTACHSIKVLP